MPIEILPSTTVDNLFGIVRMKFTGFVTLVDQSDPKYRELKEEHGKIGETVVVFSKHKNWSMSDYLFINWSRSLIADITIIKASSDQTEIVHFTREFVKSTMLNRLWGTVVGVDGEQVWSKKTVIDLSKSIDIEDFACRIA